MTKGTGVYGKPSSPPVGIAYLSAFLEKNGHDTAVLDLRVEAPSYDYISEIKDFDPDLVGVSFMSSGYKMSYRIIDEIKEKTGVNVVVGGAHPSTIRNRVLEECTADYAVYREGEHAMLSLVSGRDLSDIKGLIWRKGKDIVTNPPADPILDLDSLPFPDYEKFKLDKYGVKRIPLNTARGCPHLCTYCAVDLVIGRRFRARTPVNVVDEIEYWYKKGYRNFGFNDSTFTEIPKRSVGIAEEIIKRGIKIEWDLRTGIRVDRVNPEVLRKLKDAGCTFIAFGIESIDADVIALMKKGIKYEQVEKAVNAAKEAGIGVGGFFMIGTPGDTYRAFRRSYDFADRDVFDEVRFYNTEPYPGTELFDWIRQNGRFLYEPSEYLNSRSRWEEQPIFETDDFPEEERRKAFNESQYLVAKKLAVKILGKRLGVCVYVPCRIKLIRKFVLMVGFSLAPLMFKLLKMRKGNSK